MSLADPRLNRRSLLAFATAVSASGLLTHQGLAQDATPAAEAEATPGTGIQAGDTIPPEYQNAADTDWLTEGRNLAQDRNVTGSGITSESVSGLAEAWTMDINISAPYGALVSNPIILGDTLFLQDANSNVYAVNRETGEEIWTNTYGADVPSGGPNGIAVGYGVIVYPVGNGLIIAADPATGEERWSRDITGPAGEGVCMAPLIYDNKVWVSNTPASTAEDGMPGISGKRGMIYVLDITTGGLLWYFDTTKDNLWDHPAYHGGGGLWHPPAVSQDGEMFYAIGNIYPYPGDAEYPNGISRPGDNDYANNVLRIDKETGSLIWNENITGRDIFDLDTHLVVTGVVDFGDDYSRELVFASGKHGYVVALDPESGAQHWRTPVGTHRNAHLQEVPEDAGSVEVWPGTLGGVETPFAYANNVVYTAILELPTVYTPVGIEGGFAFSEATGALAALDATDGSKIWEIPIVSGALAAATVVNDLVFTGTLDGRVRAYSTADGSLVWSAQTTAGLNAPLAISGDYLYVPAGGPAIPSAETEDFEPAARLVAYKLG